MLAASTCSAGPLRLDAPRVGLPRIDIASRGSFGIDSVIELVSAGVLYRRLTLEATGGVTCKVEAIEAGAGKIGEHFSLCSLRTSSLHPSTSSSAAGEPTNRISVSRLRPSRRLACRGSQGETPRCRPDWKSGTS